MGDKFGCPRANCQWRRGEMCAWVNCPYAKEGEKEEEEDAD